MPLWDYDTRALVFDIGSDKCHAGFTNGDGFPGLVFPTVVGRPKQSLNKKLYRNAYVGDETQDTSYRDLLTLNYPIGRDAIITNWDDMEELWRHIFNKLRVASDEHPVLLTEVPFNPRVNREKTTEIMFENFSVPGMYLAVQYVLSLYASGRTTGIVFGSGEGASYSVPVYEGHSLSGAVGRTYFGGGDLTYYLMGLLKYRDFFGLGATDKRKIVRDIKETLCYVALDFEKETKRAAESSALERSYELPDGNVITVGKERFRCPEVLFQPKFISMVGRCGVHELVFNSIGEIDADIRKDLYSNVVLSGGSALFEGFAERLTKELTHMAPASMKIKVIPPVPGWGEFSVWDGGSILGMMYTSREIWITKEEYEEYGTWIVHRKCF